MATRIVSTETRTQLDSLLGKWAARWRLRRVVMYLPRVLIATFLVGIVTAFIVAILGQLSASQMLLLAGITMGMTFTLIAGGLGLWSKRGQAAALQFDSLFELQERLATAFEILDGRIQTTPEIAERQLQDTYDVAKNVDPKKHLPLQVKWLDWLIAVITLVLLTFVLGYTAFTLAARGGSSAGTDATIAAAADTTRDITAEIATDSNLTDEERNSLLESAETALDDLENPDISAEDSFVAMSDLESDLRDQVEALRESIENSDQGLQGASEALGNPSEAGDPGEQLADDLENLSNELDTMSEEELAALAEDLREAADEVREENEDLANSLDEAAESLQNNQTSDAQSSMSDASQQAQSSAQRNQSRSETADSLEQSADQAQQSASDIAESESQQSDETQQQQGQQGQQQEGQEGQQSQQQGEQGQQQDGQGQGQNPNSDQQSDSGAPVQSEEDEGSQPGDGSSESSQEGQSDAPPGDNDEGGQGAGAGDNSASQQSQDITGTGTSDQSDTQNDGGETDYEAVFAPEDNSIQPGSETVELDTDENNSPVVEGDFQENPTGESSVPYNQIYSDYANAANSALENGYVPLGVRDVVRDYFTSIEPTGNQDGE